MREAMRRRVRGGKRRRRVQGGRIEMSDSERAIETGEMAIVSGVMEGREGDLVD